MFLDEVFLTRENFFCLLKILEKNLSSIINKKYTTYLVFKLDWLQILNNFNNGTRIL